MKVITEEQIREFANTQFTGVMYDDYGEDLNSEFVEAFVDGAKWVQEKMKPHPRVTGEDRLRFEELFKKAEGKSNTQKWKEISSITGFSVQTIRLSLKSDEDKKETFYNPKKARFF